MDFTFIFLIGITGVWLADLTKMPREFSKNIFLTRYAINDTGRLDVFGTKSFFLQAFQKLVLFWYTDGSLGHHLIRLLPPGLLL